MANANHEEKSAEKHTVEILVNEHPVMMQKGKATGREIKAAAIAHGVSIQLDFTLSEEKGGKGKIVGDDDEVQLHKGQRFVAVASDDNS